MDYLTPELWKYVYFCRAKETDARRVVADAAQEFESVGSACAAVDEVFQELFAQLFRKPFPEERLAAWHASASALNYPIYISDLFSDIYQ